MKHIPLVSLRLVRERSVPYESRTLKNSAAIFDLFRAMVQDLDREAVWLACLDTKNRLACLSQVSVGSLDSSLVHPREVMKTALLASASAIVLVHNHPSGDPTPSREDEAITQRIKGAADLLGVRFLDHVIIGDGDYFSFTDQGRL